MPERVPTPPPDLAGFEYVSLIGSGGYADVFLYEQASPARRVAVKVLDLAAVPGGGGRDMFTAEANLMARVSAHPYIVQVFQSDIAPDGRPYLIMEYYPGPNFSDRARTEQISVAEALRVGVQLASAVETAHRAGILHRDIKPANVLTSEYRRPGLTDFGIAAVQGPEADTAGGLSIPWSPPEALGESAPDRRSDVYSLAATVYTLVAGRSPFEIPGGDNRALSLIGRIERHPLPSTGRADAPASLERVLAHAMAKTPAQRPATAADLGRQLQEIESELRLGVTPLELADDARTVRARTDEVDGDSTRVKAVTELHAQDSPIITAAGAAIAEVPSAGAPATDAPIAAAPVEQRRREGLLAPPEIGDTVMRPPTAEPELAAPDAPGGIPKPWLAAGGLAAAIVLLIVGTIVLGGGDDAADADQPRTDELEVNDNIGQPIAVSPPALDEVAGSENDDGSRSFTWEDRGAGVTYAVTPDGGATERVDEPRFDTFSDCIEVEVIAESGLISAPTRGCVT